jgi:protein-disulfide isomerase
MRYPVPLGLICLLAAGLVQGCAPRAQQSQEPVPVSSQLLATITAQTQMWSTGARQPDVQIVEYMDYNCPYCRAMAPDLHRLLQADPHLQIIYKEWPILGDTSIYAARSALAAGWQGQYLTAHDALIGRTRALDQTSDVDVVLGAAGLDLTRLAADRDRHASQISALLARSETETQTAGIKGTPALLVGRQLVARSVSLPQLQSLVAEARADHR